MAQEQQLKYRILEDEPETFTHPITGEKITAYRIQSLRTFKTCGRDAKLIRKGDLGGFVSTEDNLSQGGRSWIDIDSAALQNSRVQDNAYLSGGSSMFDQAQLKGSAEVADTTVLSGGVTAQDQSSLLGKNNLNGRHIILIREATVTDTELSITDNSKITIAGSLRGAKNIEDLLSACHLEPGDHDIYIGETACVRL